MRRRRTAMPRATSLRPMWPKSVMMRKSQQSERQQPPAGHAPRMAATCMLTAGQAIEHEAIADSSTEPNLQAGTVEEYYCWGETKS